MALLLAASVAAATGPEGASAVAKPDKYNCGRNWWEAVTAFLGGGWPEDKKEWCCKHRKVGCQTKPPANKIEYDCHKGYEVRDEAWSEAKRNWCCDHEQLGCKTSAWNEEPYDCRLGLSHWQEKWSNGKKAWCCEFEGHGCGPPSTKTTTEPFDCIADLLMWQLRWSTRRQAWCCRHHGRGCPPTTELHLLTDVEPTATRGQAMRTPEAYNCSGDTTQWETWPLAKQAACCDPVRCPVAPPQMPPRFAPLPQVTTAPATTATATTATTTAAIVTTTTMTTATTTTTTGELFDCELGEANAPQGWTGWKKEWCCDRRGIGCATTTTWTGSTTGTTVSSKPYNCLDAVSNWEKAWSREKKQWCCKHELRGCTDCDVACVVAGFPASCRNRIEWLRRHDLKQQENGCAHARHIVLEECPACKRCNVEDACPAIADVEKKYDCEAGFGNWEAGWSRTKKDWCCRTYDLGCPPPTTVTSTTTTVTEPFDCIEGLSSWQQSWTNEKQAWCCRFKRLGCTACDVSCLVDGISASCRDRVGWLVGHVLHDKEDACTSAHDVVLDQCPNCATCGMIDACPAAVTTTSVPYDCRVGLAHWRHHWSEGKRSWCCRHADVGCRDAEDDEDAPGAYNCQVDLSTWSVRKMEWCCNHRQLGCSLLATRVSTAAVTTTSMTTTATSTTEEHFDCQSGVLHWGEIWPQRKKEWCCSRYTLGCSSSQSHGQRDTAAQKVVLALQWVARDALPEEQGETLRGYSVTAGSLEEMKRWCEDRSDCVGFAAQPETLRWAPKKVGTGFNARTAAWTTDQPEGQVWRWYYIKQRAEDAQGSELAAKFEQLEEASVRGKAWKLHGVKEVPFLTLSCLSLLLAALFVVRVASIRFMRREDCPAYVALQPAQGGAIRGLGQELPSSTGFSHASCLE